MCYNILVRGTKKRENRKENWTMISSKGHGLSTRSSSKPQALTLEAARSRRLRQDARNARNGTTRSIDKKTRKRNTKKGHGPFRGDPSHAPAWALEAARRNMH